MPGISCQFWALPEEMAPLIDGVVRKFELHTVGMKFFPYRAVEIRLDQLRESILSFPEYRRYAFTLNPPSVVESADQIEFANMNPDRLTIDIGRVTEKGLTESWLTTRAQCQKAFAVWKEIAKRLRKMTTAGVTAINPETGESGYERTFRYTVGAKQCEAAGIPILPVAGTVRMRLGKLDHSSTND